jgi:flagellar motor switch/type III secretory pathway protein FliN
VNAQATGGTAGGVRLEFGRQWLPCGSAGRLGPDAVVELDVPADGNVDVYADGCLRARGEPVVIDGKLCIRVREVVQAAEPAAVREGS